MPKQTVQVYWNNFARWIRQTVCPFTNKPEKPRESGPADIEDAITATGFGKFNILLMAFAIPAAMASTFDTTTMSFVITSAECDLNLSLVDKGVLNAVTHAGMIFSCLISGYLADTLGRKKVLIYCFLLDSVCNIVAAFSQNFIMLATLKFCSGFIMCGPCTIIITCLTEFFSSFYRPIVVMYVGICFAFGNVILPFIAWAIMSNPFDTVIFNIVIHSWQVFMIVCSLPSLLSGLLSILLPESPRFLLSQGREQEALQTLKQVYAINNKCSPDDYPIKELNFGKKSEEDKLDIENNVKESAEKKEGTLSAIRGGLNQVRSLFSKQYMFCLILINIVEFGCLTGSNTVRLWLPQLFKMMIENDEKQNVCKMMALTNTNVARAPISQNETCVPISVDSRTYLYSALAMGIHCILCMFSSLMINPLGKKNMLVTLLIGGGVCCISIFWCSSITQAAILAAISTSFNSMSSNALMSLLVDLFPTNLRALTASLVLMTGRIGTTLGNVTFPLLLATGCLPPFLTIGLISIGCGLVSILIPKSQKGQI